MADCGTRQAYRNGCRCDSCVEAGQGYLAERRAREARRRERNKAALSPEKTTVIGKHGISGYQRGCRCADCVSDMTDARIARREKSIAPPDWSDVAHLKPGAGIKRRTG